jgi:hypothetical protein
MALKKTDKKEYRNGLKRNANKFFGEGESGKTFLHNVASGAYRGISFGFNPKDGDQKFALSMAQFMMVAMPTLIVSSVAVDRVDFEVPHDTSIAANITQDGGSQIYGISGQYEFEADKYMLINTEDGYQLYSSSADERIGPDNRFTLVTSPIEASEIAASMTARYNLAMADGADELDAENDPYLITYEGISPVYQEDKSAISEVASLYELDLRNRIADDFVEIEHSYEMQPHAEAWQEAFAQFSGGETMSADVEAIALSDHYDTAGRELAEGLALLLAVYGTLTGAGAVIGAASGMNSSRRRFNKDMGISKP